MILKDQLKSNIGIIILSVSIIIASSILSDNKIENNAPIYSPKERIVRLSGDYSEKTIPINISTNSNDVTFNYETKLINGESLVVELNNGNKYTIKGKNIVARYYLVSKLLMVESHVNDRKSIQYYYNPIRWQNVN